MAILITGASGFIGLNLLDRCLASGLNVLAVANSPLPEAAERAFAALPGRLDFRRLDVTDEAAVMDLMAAAQIERVIHGAAVTAGAARERRSPRSIVDVNIGGVASVVEAAARRGVERIVFIGSIAAYGRLSTEATVDEDAAKAPATLYEISKFAGEGTALRLARLFDLDLVVGRLGTVFGPWEHASGVRDTLSPIHQVTARAWHGGTAILPRPARANWHYAGDAADALCQLATAERCQHRIYNLGSPASWTLRDWCEKLEERFADFTFELDADRANIALYGEADPGRMATRRFRGEFPGAAAHDLDAAFDAYLEQIESREGFGMDR